MSNNIPYKDRLKYLKTDDDTISKVDSSISKMVSEMYRGAREKFSITSPFGNILTAFKEFKNLDFFYIDRAINENNIKTAESSESVRGLVANSGFNALRSISAKGSVRMNINPLVVDEIESGRVFLRRGATFKSEDSGLIYYADLPDDNFQIQLNSSNETIFGVVEGIVRTLQFYGTGEQFDTKIITTLNNDIENDRIKVVVDGTEWTKYDLLRDMGENDTGYLIINDFDNGVKIHFGDGYNGVIPPENSSIIISFVETNGSVGNIPMNSKFILVSGVTLPDGVNIDINDFATITAEHDFISGYDGDDIDKMRLNNGLQSHSYVLSNEDHIRSYLRRYPRYNTVRVWSNIDAGDLNALIVPNLSYKTSGVFTYFDLPLNEFIISDSEIDNIKQSIINDKKYSLQSTIDISKYDVLTYGILVYANFKNGTLPYKHTVYNEVNSIIEKSLMEQFANEGQTIRKSIIIEKLMSNVQSLESVNIQFVSGEHGSQYIDSTIGDIDTREVQSSTLNSFTTNNSTIYLPIIRSGSYGANNTVFSTPIKILYEERTNVWVEY